MTLRTLIDLDGVIVRVSENKSGSKFITIITPDETDEKGYVTHRGERVSFGLSSDNYDVLCDNLEAVRAMKYMEQAAESQAPNQEDPYQALAKVIARHSLGVNRANLPWESKI